MSSAAASTIFVTGATGYIGGRLAPRLIECGYRVRCLARSRAKLLARPWAEHERVEVVEGDAGDEAVLTKAMHGCAAAYFLVHSMDAARAKVETGDVETAWSDAGVMPGDPAWAGGTEFLDRREMEAAVPATAAWSAICSLGGELGYHAADWLWRLRGRIDRLSGGPGLRRGRRSARELRLGDALDFWRVTAIEAPRRLVLTAEMKLPGVATLSFDVAPTPMLSPVRPSRCTIVMTARFRPRGLLGIAYWYAVLPLHGIVFRGMLAGLVRAAERSQGGRLPAKPVALARLPLT